MKKQILTGFIAAGAVAMQSMMPTVANAAVTSVQYKPTTITMAGHMTLNAYHVVANDPWSGQATSWVPVYYLQELLKTVGVENNWDNANTLRITSTPGWWQVLSTNTSYTGAVPQGQMLFAVSGHNTSFIRAPKLVAKDPASGVNTTYVPIYYADLFLQEGLGMKAIWSGNAWNMTPQTKDDITHQTYASEAAASDAIATIQRENTYLGFNQGQMVDLGLGIIAEGDAGMGHEGLQWHEGRWTVQVLSYTVNRDTMDVAKSVVAYLHTHMLPAPQTEGVIVISSTDWNSTQMIPKTIIAWQEGNVVYQLQTMNPPLDALQTVVISH